MTSKCKQKSVTMNRTKKGVAEYMNYQTKVFRIPTKEFRKRNNIMPEKSWKDLYGRMICWKCKQHFCEGDAYRGHVYEFRHWKPVYRYEHVECPVIV